MRKACTAVTTTADIIHTESAERQLPTEQTRTSLTARRRRVARRTGRHRHYLLTLLSRECWANSTIVEMSIRV